MFLLKQPGFRFTSRLNEQEFWARSLNIIRSPPRTTLNHQTCQKDLTSRTRLVQSISLPPFPQVKTARFANCYALSVPPHERWYQKEPLLPKWKNVDVKLYCQRLKLDKRSIVIEIRALEIVCVFVDLLKTKICWHLCVNKLHSVLRL